MPEEVDSNKFCSQSATSELSAVIRNENNHREQVHLGGHVSFMLAFFFYFFLEN